MKTTKKKILNLGEKFIPVGVKTIDSKNRITIGEKILKLITVQTDVEEFQIFYGKEGDILLRPMVSIPTKEAWIYRNPKVLRLIRKGLAEAEQGKTERVENLDKFLRDL